MTLRDPAIDCRIAKQYFCYYQYIPEDKEEIAFENAKRLGIDVIKLDSKEYEKMSKDNNYNYNYKYVYMINEIIEL